MWNLLNLIVLLKLIFKIIKLNHVLLLEKGVSVSLQVSKYFFLVSPNPFWLKHCCSLDSNDDNNDDNNSDDNNGHNDNFLGWNVSGDKVTIKTGYALVNVFYNSPCCKGRAAGEFSNSFHCC